MDRAHVGGVQEFEAGAVCIDPPEWANATGQVIDGEDGHGLVAAISDDDNAIPYRGIDVVAVRIEPDQAFGGSEVDSSWAAGSVEAVEDGDFSVWWKLAESLDKLGSCHG
jgi:hypothetical protein